MKKGKRIIAFVLSALMAASALPFTASASSNKVTITPGATADGGTPVTKPVGSVESTVEPYIIDMTSVGNLARSGAEWRAFDNEQEGKQKFVVNSGDDNSCQLLYYVSEKAASFAPFRGFLRFKAADTITKEHKWIRITYKAVDDIAATVNLLNNAGGGDIDIVTNTMASNGEWVVSEPVNIDACGILDRFVVGNHVTVQYTSTNPNAKFYIKNVMFFGSKEQAYAYTDEADMSINYSQLTFGISGNGTTLSGSNYGNYTFNDGEGTLDIVYAESTNMKSNYMAKIQFKSAGDYNNDHIYLRVLYAAKHPEGVDSVGMYMVSDHNGATTLVASDVKDTAGEFVLSPTQCLANTQNDRFSSGKHVSFVTDDNTPGGEYRIKALFFFATREEADAFVPSLNNSVKLTINGNDISLYKIVADTDIPAVYDAAFSLQSRIYEVTGVKLDVVGDDSTPSEYEIIVGRNDRTESVKKFNELQNAEYKSNRAVICLEGNKLVFCTALPKACQSLVDSFKLTKLYEGITKLPESIVIDESVFVDTEVNPFTPLSWGDTENVDDPEVFNYSFDFDEGYFNEENTEDSFEYYNGVMRTKAGVKTGLSYVHVYEKDVEMSASLKYTEAENDGEFGVMTRYNSAFAWIKAGYDFKNGEWYIDTCMGADFYTERIAVKADSIKADTWYTLTLKVDENVAKFYVNGEKILESDKASHLSPGRVGVYTDGASIAVDNAKITLISGEGIIWKDVAHTKLETTYYMEGGTVYEMLDGSLIYQHHSGTCYKSVDDGKSWTATVTYFPRAGYPNMIRLNNGDWLQMFTEGGYWKSRTSSDDGKTWVTGGILCPQKYTGSENAGAGNMNDKLMVTASGRIFYGQNYEGKTAHEGRYVFCEFYFSDDNGKTWYKSDTDSWEIEGNEKQSHFGEAKLLECADGTIRMYDSWNAHGCIVYSDSTDGGKTFGPLQYMYDFPCSRSSMQFCRDVYADNDYTYYMVWVNNETEKAGSGLPRSRLTMAKSTDGKNWTVLGDVWRWENEYRGINQVVDPFINVTEDYVLVGSGFSEHTFTANEGAVEGHNAQRQHIYSIPKASLEEGEALYKFTDVDSNDSYYEAVKYAVDNGLFNGTSDTTFAPDTVMNRAMFVTVLGRLAKADVSKYTTPTFDDVKADQWYTSYVEWAAANGIVNGIGGGKYGVDGQITVEQACTILYRYANGKTAAEKSGLTVADFTDGECVSSWATDAVKWTVENGIYTGVGEALSPSCAAPRWLVATMFANYVNVIG